MRSVLFFSLLTISGMSIAGMMGHSMGMGGGMMGSQSAPPAQNTNPNIRKGYQLVETYCTQCHQMPNPNQHTPADWQAVVSRMEGYMQQQGRPLPSDGERKLLLDYLGQ